MEHHPDPMQSLLLWNLAVNQGTAWLADLKGTLADKSKRTSLIRAGLIVEQKRPRVRAGKRTVRAIQLTLEDKGWAWLADHPTAPISHSKAAADVLQALLGIIAVQLERNRLALADFMTPDAVEAALPVVTEPRPARIEKPQRFNAEEPDESLGELLESRIADTYAELAHHRSAARVRLADLRRRLSDLSPEQVNAALRKMTREGRVVLNRLDNPLEITAEDEAAKLLTPLGDPRHIMHMEILAHV